MDPYASPAGLTRGSIILGEKFFAKKMDGRVKPGHDGATRDLLEIATSSSHCALQRAKWYPLGLGDIDE